MGRNLAQPPGVVKVDGKKIFTDKFLAKTQIIFYRYLHHPRSSVLIAMQEVHP